MRLEQQMQQRSQALEAQARAVCVQAQALYVLQQSLDYRFGGEPLQMLELTPPAHSEDAPAPGSIVAVATR